LIVHLALIPGDKTAREIHDSTGNIAGILHLSRGGILITEPKPKKKVKVSFPNGRMF